MKRYKESSDSFVSIPFCEIKVLATGRVQAIGQPGAGAMQTLLTLAGSTGLITAVTSKNTAVGTQIWWGAGAGAAAAIGAGIYLNRRTNNYISIFYRTSSHAKVKLSKMVPQSRVTTIKTAPNTQTVTTEAAPPAEPFSECNVGCGVAVFQIIDPHDFWNTLMFLSAETGLSAQSESAIEGASPTPPPQNK